MAVYHITYARNLSEVCLYFSGGCAFSCRGCVTDSYPLDCHLDEKVVSQTKNRILSTEEVISYLKPLSFKKVIFLGKEPTHDIDFLVLAKSLKEKFSSYNICLTNGYKYIKDEAIDEVCVSIKAVSKRIFKDFTGLNNPARVITNFRRYVATPNLKVRAESIFIPGYIGTREIEKIASFIASVDNSIPYRIDGYIPKRYDSFHSPTVG
jgi:pyruvate-formate lyase-activating enzyme